MTRLPSYKSFLALHVATFLGLFSLTAHLHSEFADEDYDQDGIENFKDVCPQTPIGLPVNAMGCAPDQDRDGVADAVDRCVDTPREVEVNDVGCPDEGRPLDSSLLSSPSPVVIDIN